MPETPSSPDSFDASRASLPLLASLAVGLFALLQLALWAMGAQPGDRANVWWWTALSTLAAERGFFNVWTPYPPAFAVFHYWLVKLFGADTRLLARYFFEGDQAAEAAAAYEQTFATMKLVWSVFNAALLAGQAILIFRMARWRLSRQESLLAACAFVLFNLSWRSQIVIGLACDQFDYLPSFLFLLGIVLLVEGRPAGSALATGMGIMTKVYPGLLVPLAWSCLGTLRGALRYTAMVLAVCLVVAAPFLYVNPADFLATYQSTGSRPGWESVWTFPDKAFPHMPAPRNMVGQFDTPIPEVAIFLKGGRNAAGSVLEEDDQRFVLELPDGEQATVFKMDILYVRWMRAVELKDRILMLVTLAALLAMAWVFRNALRQRESLPRAAFLSVLAMLVFSKGISSYFLLWFFPFLFILYRPLAACALFGLFLLVGNLEFVGGAPWPCYWPSIFLRQALLLAVAADQMRRMRRPNG